MFCEKCGNKLSENENFCTKCGAKVAEKRTVTNAEPTVAVNVNVTEVEQAVETKSEKPKKEKKPLNKKTKKRIVCGGIIGLATALVVVALVFVLLPFQAKISGKYAIVANNYGIAEDASVVIETNKIIKKVEYAYASSDEAPVVFLPVREKSGIFNVNINMNGVKILAGESEICFRVTDIFGRTQLVRVETEYNMGYTSAPESGALTYIDDTTRIVNNEIILMAEHGTKEKTIEEIVSDMGGEIVGAIYLTDTYQIRFSGYIDHDSIIEELLQNDEIISATVNTVIDGESAVYPNDTEWEEWSDTSGGNNWGLEAINVPKAWDYIDGMQTVNVGVLDSILYYNHEDLDVDKSHVSIMPNDEFKDIDELLAYFEEDHYCGFDCDICGAKNHGTHCAGIMSALANNKKGISGVNWKSNLYFSCLWYYSTEDGFRQVDTTLSLQYGIARLVASDCRVINMSFGSIYPTTAGTFEEYQIESFDEFIKKLEDAGYDFLLFKSAGNDGTDASRYYLNRLLTGGEHSRAHTVIVGSICQNSGFEYFLTGKIIYNVASYSNSGELVDIMAPGTNIYSTVFANEYQYMSGTSMAAPMAAGVASLVYSQNPSLTYDQVKNIICNTSENTCADSRGTYFIVDAYAAVKAAAESNVNPEETEKTGGFVTGMVTNAWTGELLSGVSVCIENIDGSETYIADTENGSYYYFIPAGTYNIKFKYDEFVEEIIYNVVITEGVATYNMAMTLVSESEENGFAEGKLIDAFDASAIPNAELKFFTGLNNDCAGTPVATMTTNDIGHYSIELAPGNYTVLASAEGYQTGKSHIRVIGNESIENQNCTLTPILNEGEARIVLTWGEYPRDLDSHLTGPAPGGTTFHIYYSNKNYYGESNVKYDNLDVDDTTSYGPETTSVYVGLDGTYTFSVHDYSNRNSSYSTQMAYSGATVKVYVAGQDEPTVFYVPNQEGTLWKVCSITNGVVTPINEMSYHSNPSTIG